jgi:hypothetical protein
MRADVSRRSWLIDAGAMLAGLSLLPQASGDATPRSDYADPIAAENWLMTWMKTRDPVGTLHLSRFKDRTYFLIKKIGWKPGKQNSTLPTVEVPKGFVTDFASIPRVFWSILPADGDYTYPAILHDYLYWRQHTSRETADRIFKVAMEEFGIDGSKIAMIHTAVRAGGGFAWDGNKKLRAAGESRILKVFPTDPRTTWKEWKAKKSNFR